MIKIEKHNIHNEQIETESFDCFNLSDNYIHYKPFKHTKTVEYYSDFICLIKRILLHADFSNDNTLDVVNKSNDIIHINLSYWYKIVINDAVDCKQFLCLMDKFNLKYWHNNTYAFHLNIHNKNKLIQLQQNYDLINDIEETFV